MGPIHFSAHPKLGLCSLILERKFSIKFVINEQISLEFEVEPFHTEDSISDLSNIGATEVIRF